MKQTWFNCGIYLAALVFVVGCTARTATWPYYLADASKPRLGHNPLEGWKGGTTAYEGCPFDKSIIDNYRNYIQNLPAEERTYVDDFNIRFYEGPNNQHAVEITIPINGVRWKHVLVYDGNNRRTNVIKYASSRYRS